MHCRAGNLTWRVAHVVKEMGKVSLMGRGAIRSPLQFSRGGDNR